MTMLRGPVLVGTDLSRAAEEALKQAQRLAADLDGELIVCHILPELLRVGMLFPQWRGIDATAVQSLTGKAEAAVRAQLQTILGADATRARVVLDSGTAHAGLLTQAEEVRAGVIVVGPGEVARHVVQHASVPVLVARPSSGEGVVGATDFSDPSLPGLEVAAGEARRRHARLHLVHALDVDMFSTGQAPAAALPYLEGTSAISMDGLDHLRDIAQQRLSDMLTRTGVPGDATVVSGHAAEAIVRAAETVGAQLVVVGTHGRSGLARVTLGSTAEAVIDRAPCSVLVVRLARDGGR